MIARFGIKQNGEPRRFGLMHRCSGDRRFESISLQLIMTGLLGWAARGFIFGILADYIGRVRALMFSIALYSLFTAMQGFRSVCSISVCLASSPASAPGAEIIVAFRCWPRRSAK